jgi:hypothetical protein
MALPKPYPCQSVFRYAVLYGTDETAAQAEKDSHSAVSGLRGDQAEMSGWFVLKMPAKRRRRWRQ